jgi:hypothetical protein
MLKSKLRLFTGGEETNNWVALVPESMSSEIKALGVFAVQMLVMVMSEFYSTRRHMLLAR